jgi:3,4-dihydroxy 2-butanone 4-phosphate synthase/GTP cyclohydrolase II
MYTLDPIINAIDDFKNGNFLIVVDDQNRENEGDFIVAAQMITPDKVNFMMTHGKGVLCAPITEQRCRELDLPMQVEYNTSMLGTPFTVSVDKLGDGCTTGVSMADRAKTIRALADPNTQPTDLGRPGHVNPLRARNKGVLTRPGHTEAAVDLAKLAGLFPAAALIEIINDDGTMARLPQLFQIAEKFKIKIISIEDLIQYRLQLEANVEQGVQVNMPTKYGNFKLIPFRQLSSGLEHIALIKGNIQHHQPTLLRVHSSCITGDIFGSLRCECGEQLHLAMKMVEQNNNGIILYLNQEGRGIGLMEKIKAYQLQENGVDTVDANIILGHQVDERDYGIAAQILIALGVTNVKLITNNPHKQTGLQQHGINVKQIIPIEIPTNPHNQYYMKTKKEKMGHQLKMVGE